MDDYRGGLGDFCGTERRSWGYYDPDVLSSVDYENEATLEGQLLKERQEAEQKYREHDERIKALLA